MDTSDVYLFNTGCGERAYLYLGCHRISGAKGQPGGFRFALWAPHARAVALVGDFNGWQGEAHQFKLGPGGVWELSAENIAPDSLYKFRITGADGLVRDKADPFAFSCELSPGTASKVADVPEHTWGDGDFLRQRAEADPLRQPISIYELHLGSWRRAEGQSVTYAGIAEELAEYCREMGYTHVELLPICEYPYDESWGYQVSGYFAPTARYGEAEGLMQLVDTLHQNGIGVLLDWVPAHFPRDAHALAWFDGSPLFEVKDSRRAAHPEWGTLIFDYACPEVRSFLISSALFWLDRFHIDGLRVDAVSSMLYLNYGREGRQFRNEQGGEIDLAAVDFLRQLNRAVAEHYPGCLTVAEESTAYPLVTGDPAEGGLGFSLKWDMGLMHDSLDFLREDPLWRCYHHDKLSFSMLYAFSEHFVNAFSHDEAVHGKKSLLDKMCGSYEQKFANLRLLFGLQFGHPGKKLMFMGSEFGQFIEWNHRQPLDWFLLQYPIHDSMREWVRSLNWLYRTHPALWRVDDSWAGFLWLSVDDREHGCVAFMRRSDGNDAPVVCLLSYTPVSQPCYIGLPQAGRLVELLNSDEFRFAGSGVVSKEPIKTEPVTYAGLPCRAQILLPPLSAVFYRFEEDREEEP